MPAQSSFVPNLSQSGQVSSQTDFLGSVVPAPSTSFLAGVSGTAGTTDQMKADYKFYLSTTSGASPGSNFPTDGFGNLVNGNSYFISKNKGTSSDYTITSVGDESETASATYDYLKLNAKVIFGSEQLVTLISNPGVVAGAYSDLLTKAGTGFTTNMKNNVEPASISQVLNAMFASVDTKKRFALEYNSSITGTPAVGNSKFVGVKVVDEDGKIQYVDVVFTATGASGATISSISYSTAAANSGRITLSSPGFTAGTKLSFADITGSGMMFEILKSTVAQTTFLNSVSEETWTSIASGALAAYSSTELDGRFKYADNTNGANLAIPDLYFSAVSISNSDGAKAEVSLRINTVGAILQMYVVTDATTIDAAKLFADKNAISALTLYTGVTLSVSAINPVAAAMLNNTLFSNVGTSLPWEEDDDIKVQFTSKTASGQTSITGDLVTGEQTLIATFVVQA